MPMTNSGVAVDPQAGDGDDPIQGLAFVDAGDDAQKQGQGHHDNERPPRPK